MPSPIVQRSQLPTIAIVGRANVGKSTFWNKVIERRRAIVSNSPHTTRDRNTDIAYWRGRAFQLTDTGGYDTEDNEIGEGIRRQVDIAMKEADVILFFIDGRTGVLDEDRLFVKELRKTKKKVILVANKIDNPRNMAALGDSGAYSVGFGDPIPVSAATGKGVGDLLDALFQTPAFKKKPSSVQGKRVDATHGPRTTDDGPLNIAIIGRTNVGKSSLVNAILGEERVIVANIPHTTREPQDTQLTYNGEEIVLVDTAGMRRRARIKKGLDTEAMQKNREALERADVAFLVLDTTEDIASQDKELAGLMKDEHKGLVIVGNKWDLVEDKTTKSAKEYEQKLRAEFPFLAWAPIVFISAKTGKRTKDLLDIALKIQKERERTIDYNAINRLLKSVIKQKRPLQVLGPKSPYIYDVAQVGVKPPTFLVTIRGEKQSVHASWLKFLEKRIRMKFGFEGTPIVVKSTNVPASKVDRAWNVRGPGMDAVAGSS